MTTVIGVDPVADSRNGEYVIVKPPGWSQARWDAYQRGQGHAEAHRKLMEVAKRAYLEGYKAGTRDAAVVMRRAVELAEKLGEQIPATIEATLR